MNLSPISKSQSIPNNRLTFQYQTLSLNYLLKRSPKYIRCNFPDSQTLKRNEQNRAIFCALRRAKNLRKLDNIQPIVQVKQYSELIKHNIHTVDSPNALNCLQAKPIWLTKYLVKKIKQMKKFTLKFNLFCLVCLKYSRNLTTLSIFLQAESIYRDPVLKNLYEKAKELISLKRVFITTGENNKDQEALKTIFSVARTLPNLKEIYLRFQKSNSLRYVLLPPLNLDCLDCSLIASLEWILEPTFLSSVLKNQDLFYNLKELAFRIPLEIEQRFRSFDFKALGCLANFPNLQTLSVILELCPGYHDFFIEHLRFPKQLKKLNLGLENFDFGLILENKRESLEEFSENFRALQLDELQLIASVNRFYKITYYEFVRPLVHSQKNLKRLGFRYRFAGVMQKLKERQFLHISEIFSDVQALESLRSFEAIFEILDFTQQPVQFVAHENLCEIGLNILEVVWHESPTRGFTEDILRYIAKYKNLKNLTLRSRCNKELENIPKALNLLKRFEKLEKIQIYWNVDTLEIEDLCGFLEGIMRPTRMLFELKQVILTKSELDALVNSLRKNRSLIEVKLCGLHCDVLKQGMDGTPYVHGGVCIQNIC